MASYRNMGVYPVRAVAFNVRTGNPYIITSFTNPATHIPTSGHRRRVVCIRRQHEEAAATSAAAVRPAFFWSAADVSAGL